MRPVVALDLDGTLVDYHPHFIRFANLYFGTCIDPYGYDAREPFCRYLGVGKASYRQCKLAYRRGQMKRSVPLLPEPYPNARELTREVRSWGCDVWICTTRPYLSHDEVDDATRHNLRRHGVQYQGILWGEHKYRELVRTIGRERVVAVLDDVPEMCQQAEGLGLPVAFAVRPHNAEQYSQAVRAGVGRWPTAISHNDTVSWVRMQLEKWEAGQ